MRQFRPFIYALLTSTGFIVLMFVLQTVILRKANMWTAMDMPIPLYDRILIEISDFWYKFWILLVPFIFAFPIAVAFVVAFRRRSEGTQATENREQRTQP